MRFLAVSLFILCACGNKVEPLPPKPGTTFSIAGKSASIKGEMKTDKVSKDLMEGAVRSSLRGIEK